MKQRYQGIICIIISGFFFANMTFFVRLAGDLPSMQKAFFRNFIAFLVSFFILMKGKKRILPKKKSLVPLLLRSTFGTIGLVCNFYAIDHMNISDANMLNKLSPFFAIIMSYFLLKEKANKVEWGAVIVAFVGALFIIKPSFSVEFLYALCGVMGGFGAGLAYVYVRKLGMMGEKGLIIVMCFSFFSCVFVLPFMIAQYKHMELWQLACLIGAGMFATGGQLSITAAYTKAPAKEISVFDYSQVVFAAILGFLFLNQKPDVFSVIGYVIIIGTAILKWMYSMNQDKKQRVES